jgi:hypothetical protein
MTASFTFTADAGTDTITTSAPHGRVTGDGPMVVRNVGGALPTGYTALLDVYAIVTGASTMKLALTSADALANIPILISDAGTGTHYLEIGIPYRRPRTYAPGVQLKSADLNDNFDALKALHALFTAQTQSIWTAPAIDPDSKTVFPTDILIKSTNWSVTGDISANPAGLGVALESSGAGDADFCLSDLMFDGQVLSGLRLWLTGDSAVDVTATVYKHDFDGGTVTSGGTDTESNVPASITFLDIPSIDAVANQTNRIYVRVNANAAAAKLLAIILTF